MRICTHDPGDVVVDMGMAVLDGASRDMNLRPDEVVCNDRWTLMGHKAVPAVPAALYQYTSGRWTSRAGCSMHREP